MSETIGQQLRRARETRNLTLEQVSRATHIRTHYLQALEAGDFHAMPSRAQARGFLRAYASYLDLSPEQILAGMEAVNTDAGRASAQGNSAAAPVAALPEGEAPPTPPGSPAQALQGNGSENTPEVQAFFIEVGQKLRRQRELLGLSIEDVERQTRLRTFYLRALEDGELDQLPSPVQGRGMLKNYARFLGMDPEPLLLRFADGLQARLLSRQKPGQPPAATRARRATAPGGRKNKRGQEAAPGSASERTAARPTVQNISVLRRLFSGEFLLVGLVVVFLAGFMLWGAVRIFNMRANQRPEATSRSISEVLLDPGTSTPTQQQVTPTLEEVLPFTPQAQQNQAGEEPPEETGEAGETEAEGTPGAEGTGNSTGRVEVYLTIRQRTWLRVIVDGEVQRNERVAPDSAFQFFAEDRVEVFTGNGAAVEIFYNGQDQGPLGDFGQVVYQIYTLDGMVTPTPTITPTPTPTTRPSPTPRGTPGPASPTPPS